MEKGVTSLLAEDPASGELVCRADPKHRFRLNKNGFLESTR